MLQKWNSLTFLHWRYEPGAIGRLIPDELELDTYDGAASIGLTPFLLTHLRPPFGPPLPWISAFPEMNVRTYVLSKDGRRGVWFFTLEADRLAAVMGARLSYRLPYRWAQMRVRDNGELIEYVSQRKWPFGRGSARIVVRPAGRMETGNFDHFLTARYRLYTTIGQQIAFADIDHPPWPLERVKVIDLEQDVVEHSGVPAPEGAPVAHFSRELDVRIGRLRVPQARNSNSRDSPSHASN